MRRIAGVAALALLASACELQEVTLAEADPFVVLEMFLVAGDSTPSAALHASAGAADLLDDVAGLQLTHGSASSPFVQISPTRSGGCLALGISLDAEAFPGGFACFETTPAEPVTADGFYRLDLLLDDGSRLSGATRVPEQVEITTDAGADRDEPCYLEPWTQVDLTWNVTDGTAAYILDMRAFGVEEALAREGIVADVPEPLMLRGLAIGDSDTTIVLPAEFGLFDRFSLDPALVLALQSGVPAGVTFDITVAAVDQNFVDWVRGGDFNPSGLIRTPSMFGEAGTGVIASLTFDTMYGTTSEDAADATPCGSAAPPEPTRPDRR